MFNIEEDGLSHPGRHLDLRLRQQRLLTDLRSEDHDDGDRSSAYANKAFSQLMWRVQHPDEVHYEIHLPTRLIERDSTARSKSALKNQ